MKPVAITQCQRTISHSHPPTSYSHTYTFFRALNAVMQYNLKKYLIYPQLVLLKIQSSWSCALSKHTFVWKSRASVTDTLLLTFISRSGVLGCKILLSSPRRLITPHEKNPVGADINTCDTVRNTVACAHASIQKQTSEHFGGKKGENVMLLCHVFTRRSGRQARTASKAP